jgi:hypothetical protein
MANGPREAEDVEEQVILREPIKNGLCGGLVEMQEFACTVVVEAEPSCVHAASV